MRKSQQKVIFGSLLLTIVAALLLIGGILATRSVSANKIGNPSMLSASPEEIGNAAIEYTRQNLNIISGTPQVVLNRSVTIPELPNLGLAAMSTPANPPPTWLVILKGDFDVSNLPGGAGPMQQLKATYIAYVFDLRAGTPTLVQTSLTGGEFRKALNDPSLPDDYKPVPQASKADQIPVTPTVSPLNPLPYGVVAPGVATPTKK
jgi:hypothetical protein